MRFGLIFGVFRRLASCMGMCVAMCVGMCVASCAPSLPRQYVEAKAAGHRAYSSGRYDESALHFHDAASKASRRKDRDDVLFLEAAAKQRGGRYREAQASYEAIVALSPNGRRAAAAAHESAKLELRYGDAQKGWEMVHAVIQRYPNSGVALPALQRYLRHYDDTLGLEQTIAYLDGRAEWFDAHGLGEMASYERAKRLEKLGRLQEAHDGFLACARAHLYPRGALFDDAMYRVSLIDEMLGRPREAVEHLREMLSYRERSTLHGSYERPRFSAAQMRIAELYRDALGDPDQARREFRKLFDSFKTSVLRDDALWSEALVAWGQGDKKGACDAVNLLVRELPESRYAPCARMLCEDASVLDKPRECRNYIAGGVGR